MTVGERIQFYRKKNNMSQEELGQKLLVSRQTVSLWETGQTLPTIDNLIRLREVFSISVDDILCEAEKKDEVQLPLESYTFKFNAKECEVFRKYSLAGLKKSVIIFSVLVFLSVAYGAFGDYGVLSGVSVGFFAAITLGFIKTYSLHKKSWKKSEPKILQSEYSYDFYSDYFVLRMSRENDVKKIFKIQYSEIENPCDTGEFLLFQVNGQLFYIRKADLREDTVLFGLFNKTAKIQLSDPKTKKCNVVSWILFFGSLISIYFAMGAVIALSEFNGEFVENTWVFFLFLPITIGSVIFGLKARSKNCKTTKNIVVGIIMSMILFIYGMFCVFFSDVYDHDVAVIEKVESYVGIDIPEHNTITTQDWTQNTDGKPVGGMYYSSVVTFAGEVGDSFEKQLPESEQWASDLPTEFKGLFPAAYNSVTPDYYLLYNIDSGELNTVPSETGTYRFLFVFYSVDSNSMKIIEYDTEYIK